MVSRGRTRICREGWYYLLVLAFVVLGSVLREINLLIVMAGMLLLPLLLGWRMVVAGLRPLRVARRAPASICSGDLLVVDITAQNPSPPLRRMTLGAWGVDVKDSLWREGAAGRGERISANAFFWRVERGQSQRTSYRGRLWRRGRYRFGPLTVSSRFPLGLVERSIVFDAPQELLVLPRLGRLTPAWNRLYRQPHSGSHGQQAQQTVLGGDFHSLRDWRSGDARRQIHWRTSARRRAPVVRQFEQQHSRDLVLVLDLWAAGSAGGRDPVSGDDESVERAISFAATVVHDVCERAGSHLTLAVSGSKSFQVGGAASARLMHECLAQLAVIEPGDGAPSEPLWEESLANLQPATCLIVVSTRDADAALRARLKPPAAHGRRGGSMRVVTVNAADDELSELFSYE